MCNPTTIIPITTTTAAAAAPTTTTNTNTTTWQLEPLFHRASMSDRAPASNDCIALLSPEQLEWRGAGLSAARSNASQPVGMAGECGWWVWLMGVAGGRG
eukprot:112389-Chlamydomonas_euryale.AAC.2